MLMLEADQRERSRLRTPWALAAKLVKDFASIFINFEEPVENVESHGHGSRSAVEHLIALVEELELPGVQLQPPEER